VFIKELGFKGEYLLWRVSGSNLLVDWLGIVVIILRLSLEPSHLLWHLVESVLEHDALSDDEHHVGGDENFASHRGVEPLPATCGAAEETTAVDENAAPELNADVANDEEALEAQVDAHLLAEKLLAEVIFLALPVVLADLAVVYRRVVHAMSSH